MTYWEKRHIGEKSRFDRNQIKLESNVSRTAFEPSDKILLQLKLETRKSIKGARGMPRLSEAKKDVTSCDKPRGGANARRSADFRMGEPGARKARHLERGQPGELKHLSTRRKRKQQ